MKEKLIESLSETKRHLYGGVTYMIPVILIGGLFTAISNFIPDNGALSGIISSIANIGLGQFDVFIAMFIAYSMVGKISLAPGFVLGMYSNQLGLGFIGAIIIGLLIGYLCLVFSKVKLSGSSKALFSLMVVPFAVTLILALVIHFLIATPILAFVTGLQNLLTSLSGTNAVLLGALLGAMAAFDMGGPVNKVATLFAFTMFTEGITGPLAWVYPAIMIPSLAVGVATILDRKKKLFDSEEQVAGKSAFAMGFLLMSEPAIPFALADPLFVIPVFMVIGSTAGALLAFLNVSNSSMFGPIFGIMTNSHPLVNLFVIVIGVSIASFLLLQRRKHLLQKNK